MADSESSPGQARIAGIIPARWGSTRFPGKPLHRIAGKPLIQHVWERCRNCRNLGAVIVATDDERIANAVRKFRGNVAMTDPVHPSGTDRIAEVAVDLADATHVINIQGDEPLIDPGLVDHLAAQMASEPEIEMITAANPLSPESPEIDDPNVVKVVIGLDGRALYFSRRAIPYERNMQEDLVYYRHKGIYGYRRDFLLRFVEWEPSLLERVEGLEQLRALENGATIRVVVTNDESPGVDTPEQAAILEKQIAS